MNSPTAKRPLAAHLHHLALNSSNPVALAQFHARAMGLQLRETADGLLGLAEGRRIFFVEGEPKSLAYASFAVADQAELVLLEDRLTESRWPFEIVRDGNGLFEAGAIELSDPDGNHLFFGLPRKAQDEPASRLSARLQHIVVASRNATILSHFYQEKLGFLLSDNVVDEAGALRTAFLRCSDEHHSFAVFQASHDRFDHHCYEAGDWGLIRDWGDHFASHEIKVAWGPGRHGPGNNLFLFIHDLDGNWLEISAELEIVTRGRPVGIWPHVERTLNSWGVAPLRS
jgi:catechol 2,3-dioxygenase